MLFRHRVAVLHLQAALVSILLASAALALPDEDFEQLYFEESASRYAKEHTLVRHTDSTFHLFYVAGSAGEGWAQPGNEIAFGHATSLDLEHWTVEAPVLPIDPPNGWKARNVWAPHVSPASLLVGGSPWAYVMAYAGVDSSYNQEIGIAVSNDLFAWTDLSVAAAAYHPDLAWARWDQAASWSNCRDPFLLELAGAFTLLTTAAIRPDYQGLGNRGAVSLAAAADGLAWTDAGAPLVINDHWSLMSSPVLIQNPVTADWHLLYTRNVPPGGIHYLTSSQPTAGWSITTDALLDPSSISAEVTRIGGADLYSHVEDFLTQGGLAMRAVRFDSLAWPGGVPAVVPANRFAEEWTLVEGDLGAQPTYRDRPGARSGQPSSVQGIYWVNTAEDHAGLFGGGCATCTADETQTGVLRSRPFQVTRSLLGLWVGGTASPLCYVALVDSATGTAVRTASGLGPDVMTFRQWSVADLGGRTLYIEIADRDQAGHVSVDAIEESGESLALDETLALAPPAAPPAALRATPNPAPGRTAITVPLAGPRASVAIYDPSGRLVRVLEAAAGATAGTEVEWDGRDATGRPVPAGTYFLRAAAGRAGRVTIVR